MDKNQLEQQILGFFAVTYGKNISELTLDTNIKEELSPQSMLMVALVSHIENELDVMIALPETSKFKVIRDVVDMVEKML